MIGEGNFACQELSRLRPQNRKGEFSLRAFVSDNESKLKEISIFANYRNSFRDLVVLPLEEIVCRDRVASSAISQTEIQVEQAACLESVRRESQKANNQEIARKIQIIQHLNS
jgi:hypothetical protein